MIPHPLIVYPTGLNLSHNEDQASSIQQQTETCLTLSPCNNAMRPISFDSNVASPCTDSPQSISCGSSRNSSGVFSSSSTYNDCTLRNCQRQSSCLHSNDSLESLVGPTAESCPEFETQATLCEKTQKSVKQDSPSFIHSQDNESRSENKIGEVQTKQRTGIPKTVSSLRLLTDRALPLDDNEQATEDLFCRLQVKDESISPQLYLGSDRTTKYPIGRRP
ncbi:hypothetical protein J3Q64DRAFT_1095610 [Phycomyces blakesleeanus]|uniref:Homeodomain-like DNA binding domain-containing transcription factor n=1 Tax=Phycomyces blakesleeanus TaxID=4837 RepID=A0ABR3BHF8_PHYBL